MSFLFKITDKVVYPNEETLLISPFKDVWERDTSKNKVKALEEFAFVEFVTSMKKSNPFRQYPEDRKQQVVAEAIITQEDWKPDNLVFECIDKLREFQKEGSTTYSYYLAAKVAAENMQEFFREVDITAVNPKTFNPIYKPRDITSALNDTEKVLANLKGLEKKVEEELYEEVKNRANKTISPFADPR